MSYNMQIRFTDAEMDRLRARAGAAGLSAPQFVKQQALGDTGYELHLRHLLEAVEALPPGEVFDVKQAFGPADWQVIGDRGLKLSLGRNFNKLVQSKMVAAQPVETPANKPQRYVKLDPGEGRLNPEMHILRRADYRADLAQAALAVLEAHPGQTMSSYEIYNALPPEVQRRLAQIAAPYTQGGCAEPAAYVGSVCSALCQQTPHLAHDTHYFCPVLGRWEDGFCWS